MFFSLAMKIWTLIHKFDFFFLLQFPVRSLNQNCSDGNVVSELLDKLMVLSFEHLHSCRNAGRLAEVCHPNAASSRHLSFCGRCIHLLVGTVFSLFLSQVFEILFDLFEDITLKIQKPKFAQVST